jgi:hypothetical protein
VGQGQRFFAAHFAKRNTKFGGGGKRGRAKIPSPQPPSFLPARAIGFQSSQSGFSSKKVRILTKRHRQFSEFGFWAITASPRQRWGSASARILKGFLKSKNNFCPLKRKFAVRSTDKMKFYKPIFFSFAEGERQSDNLILTAQTI